MKRRRESSSKKIKLSNKIEDLDEIYTIIRSLNKSSIFENTAFGSNLNFLQI